MSDSLIVDSSDAPGVTAAVVYVMGVVVCVSAVLKSSLNHRTHSLEPEV